MADLNLCVIQGRIVRDVELNTTTNGVEVTKFTVACNRVPVKTTGETIADFIDCVAFRNTAVFISRYFGKGDSILITGRLQGRDYVDKTGLKRKAWEIIANEVSFCGGKKNDSTSDATVNTTINVANFVPTNNDEEMPF